MIYDQKELDKTGKDEPAFECIQSESIALLS